MLTRILTAAALATALTTTAFAADNPSNSSATNGQQTAQSLPQEISAKLKDDGFTDVKVVPGSFIVSAKDKRGEPVTMMIGPDSMMMVTQANNGTRSSNGTGSSSNSNMNSQK